MSLSKKSIDYLMGLTQEKKAQVSRLNATKGKKSELETVEVCIRELEREHSARLGKKPVALLMPFSRRLKHDRNHHHLS